MTQKWLKKWLIDDANSEKCIYKQQNQIRFRDLLHTIWQFHEKLKEFNGRTFQFWRKTKSPIYCTFYFQAGTYNWLHLQIPKPT